MNTYKLVKELKENNQDFEFYPTTKEMIKTICNHIGDYSSILDIGCGTCNFKKYFNELAEGVAKEKEAEEEKKYQKALKKGETYYKNRVDIPRINQYYVIEKSRILLDKLDKDTIVLGTDFYSNILIDKKVDVIFCNPPYSDFETWTKKIIFEGNCKAIYLIIPQRWKDNKEIITTIEEAGATFEVLGSFDFLDAERAARAKVDIVYINKIPNDRWGRLDDINKKAFDSWFDDTFKMRDKKNQYESDIEKEHKEKIKTQIVNCESKAKKLVDLYESEQKTLYEHFMAISSLDVDVLETIGVKKEAAKEALKQKITSLKIFYWQLAFDELDEITSRLTSQTRNDMFKSFKELATVDFTIENIYPLILWVIKNANDYCNEQLVDFFKLLSDPNNIRNYKSNQKVFKRCNWRYNYFEDKDEVTHYTLDYRIITNRLYYTSYSNGIDYRSSHQTLSDICVVARNLGFETEIQKYSMPGTYGKKYYIYSSTLKDKPLFEYKVYKNGNTHLKFNIEFMKALNVEASRLLGWIINKEDIQKEFPEELSRGAEKYFKANNYISLKSNGLKLLEMKAS